MSALAEAFRKIGYSSAGSEGAQVERQTLCECCRFQRNDVEYYAHRNRFIKVRWLCIPCADKNEIPDEFRKTSVSDAACSGLFERQWGATRVF